MHRPNVPAPRHAPCGRTRTAVQRLAILIVAFGLLSRASPAGAVSLPAGFQETVVQEGLSEPTAFRFAPDGRIFVAEKRGIVKVLHGFGDAHPAVFADLRTSVHNYFDRGLLNLALHPDFPTRPWVYVLYVLDAPIGGTPPVYGTAGADSDGCDVPGGCVVADRVSRLDAAGDAMTGDEHVLVEDWCQWYPSHSGGGLVFGADGALYVSGGEGATATGVDFGQRSPACNDPPNEGGALRAQDLRTPGDPVGLSGSVIRIDPSTGQALPDNPLAGQPGDRIVGYGFRNPFRMTVKPGTSELWVGEVGWEDWEEIDRIGDPTARPVPDYGWPCYEGPGRQPGYEAANLPICTALYADAANGAVVAPRFVYKHKQPVVPGESCGTGDSAISGLAFGPGATFPPPFDRALFFADYARTCIWALPLDASGEPDPAAVRNFATDAAFPVDLQVGPDGDLYYVDVVGGTIRRIHYSPGNQPPIVALTADRTNGAVPLTVHFDAGTSHDDDTQGALAFAWDLDGDGAFDDSTDVRPSFVYTQPGAVTVRVQVTDADGASAIAALAVTAGNTAPVPVIEAPAAGTRWHVGQRIAFAGRATDVEEGALPGTALSWSLILHHCPQDCHIHQLQDYPAVAAGAFQTIDHDYPSFLELRLTATDAGGLTATTSLRLDPETVTVDLASDPPGLDLVAGIRRAPSPFTYTAIAGGLLSIGAPTPQTVGGVTHEFAAWSDGGAPTHDVRLGSAPARFTASFTSPAGGGATCGDACGDGRVDTACERCDLGTRNCAPDTCCSSGCTATCRPTGRCTGSGACCVVAADCPAGEGCCGNGTREAGEECDDGNALDGDCCSATCRTEPAGTCEPGTCAAAGPHVIAASSAGSRFRGARWRTRGAFRLDALGAIDPASVGFEVTATQGGATVYHDAYDAAAVRAKRSRCGRRWRTSDGGVFAQQHTAAGCSDTIRFALRGRVGSGATPAPGLLRHTLRIGDDCVTALLECRATGRRALVCTPR